MAENQAVPGIILYMEDLNLLSMLADEDFTAIMRAIVEYALDGEKPEWLNERSSATKARRRAFATLTSKIDRDKAKYARKVQQTREAGMKSAQKKANFSKRQQEKTNENSTNVERTLNERVMDVERTLNERGGNRNSNSNRNVTPTVTPTYAYPQTYTTTTTCTPEKLTELWKTLWSVDPTDSDRAAFEKMVNEGNELEDIQQAMREAHQKADENPIGYMFALLKAWKEHGKPKRPTESRDILQRRSLEERREAYEAAIVDLYEDE